MDNELKSKIVNIDDEQLKLKIENIESEIKSIKTTLTDVCKTIIQFSENINNNNSREEATYKILNSVFLITKPTHEYLEPPVLEKFVANLRLLKDSFGNGKAQNQKKI